jgi:hypothetical protein
MLQKRPLQDTELYADPDSSEKIQDSMSSSEDEWYTSTAKHRARGPMHDERDVQYRARGPNERYDPRGDSRHVNLQQSRSRRPSLQKRDSGAREADVTHFRPRSDGVTRHTGYTGNKTNPSLLYETGDSSKDRSFQTRRSLGRQSIEDQMERNRQTRAQVKLEEQKSGPFMTGPEETQKKPNPIVSL